MFVPVRQVQGSVPKHTVGGRRQEASLLFCMTSVKFYFDPVLH